MDLYKIQKILVSAHFNEKVEGLIKNLQMGTPEYIGFDTKKTKIEEPKIDGENIDQDVM